MTPTNQSKTCDMKNNFPRSKKSFQELKIAVIVSERIFQYLIFDADIFILTKDNFKYVIEHVNIDFILIESSIHFSVKDWDYCLFEFSSSSILLTDLLKSAKKSQIPVVFWKTTHSLYPNGLIHICKYFDRIYSSFLKDEICSMPAKYLPCAIQPKLFHPFSILKEKKYKNEHVLIEHSLSLIKNRKLQDFINSCDLPFKFIETSVSKQNSIQGTNTHIQFCSKSQRKKIISESISAVSFEIAPGYTQHSIWDDLEVMAMGVPLLFFGKLDQSDIRKDIVNCETTDFNELGLELYRLNDTQYRNKVSQKCFRFIHSRHTISHRLNIICDDLKISKKWIEYPLVTVCFATHRKEYLFNCIENFNKQNYNNKELIISYNGSDKICDNILEHFPAKCRDITRIIQTPKESALGAALNCAVNSSRGDYFLKMDDDDYYSENYITDMIIAVRSFEIDIFGKPQNNFFHFEGDNYLYKRLNRRGDRYFICMNDPSIRESQIVIGNSISGRTEFFKMNPFPENMYRHTDTAFFKRITSGRLNGYIAVCDYFNMIVERKRDTNFHTWMISEEELKGKCKSNYFSMDAIV